QGCVSYRVRFTAKKDGVYSEQLDIQSDAVPPPTEATVTLMGAIGNAGTRSSTTTSTTTTTTSTTTTTTLGAKTCANAGLACGYPCGGSCGGSCVAAATAGCSVSHCGSGQQVCAKLTTPTGTCTTSDAFCNSNSVCVGNASAPCGTALCWQVCAEG